MKKLKYIGMAVCMVFCASACINEEEDLFNESAAQRMNKAVNTNSELLESSAEGWVMDFYPSDGSMGGFTHTVVFKDGTASMTSEVTLSNSSTGESWPAGTIVKSLYQVKAEQECLLTFDTYNLLFHFWSEPRGSDSPSGYQSDYEFAFKKVGNDTILLKGKKYGNRMQLIRLKEPAADYLNKVMAVAETMAASPRMRLVVAGKEYSCFLINKQFTCEVEGEEEEISMAYIFTENGIRLYEPLTINGVTFQEFTIEEDMTLKAVNADASFPVPEPIEIFCAATTQWFFSFDYATDKASMDAKMWDMLKKANDENSATQNEEVVAMFVGANPGYPGNDSYPTCIGWLSRWLGILDWTVAYGIEMRPVKGTTNQLEIKLMGEGVNYSFYPFLNPLVEYIGSKSPYQITFDNDKAPTKAKLVSLSDPEAWFEVGI